MVAGVAEILVGAHRDPDFGPVLVIGWGGTFAEIFGGASICLLPTTSQRVLEMVWSLPGSVLLTGVRGQPPADVTAIVDTAMKVAAIALELGPELESLDINPLIVKRRGDGACVVDAKLLLARPQVGEAHGS
jgi:acyl-CoA synthetase (NDP forming)